MTTVARRRRKKVSEKSLELNICAELLQLIRSRSGCQGALWFGLTQAQERQEGIDARIRNAGHGVSIMLQFKAPWATSWENGLYKFSVNEQQHEAMEDLAGRNPNAVHYVFPLFSTWEKADRYAPELARDTWTVPVSAVPLAKLTASSSPSTGRHRVEVIRVNSRAIATFYSPEVVVEAVNARRLLLRGSTEQPVEGVRSDAAELGVGSDNLLGWIERWSHLRFRGLNALFIPAG